MSFAGKWSTTMSSPMGPIQGELSISESSGAFSGAMSGQGNSTDIQDVRVDGDLIQWVCALTKPMPITLQFEGQLSEPNPV